MTNKLTATIYFDYKGKSLEPSTVLDLDDLLQKHKTLPDLHFLLASLHNIDSYSYEYELMESETVQFSQPQGSVAAFFHGAEFDQIGFEKHWHEQPLFNQLTTIIKQQLDIDDINQHPKFKLVLSAAYQLGKESK